MALVSLKDVSVTRINGTGNGFSVLEQNESRGNTYKTFYTVWADKPHGLSVGDVISVSGFLSAKVGEPKTGTDGVERRYVELSLNSPRISTGEGTGGQQTPQQPQDEQWSQTPALDGEAPF